MAFALANLGLIIAWRMESTQGFHAIMNLILLPIWLLSGAFFPATGASSWLTWMMMVNPLTYGMAALRRSLYLGDPRGCRTGAASAAVADRRRPLRRAQLLVRDPHRPPHRRRRLSGPRLGLRGG